MDQQTVLLVDSDGDCEEMVAFAAAQSRCRLHWLRTAGDVFRSMSSNFDKFALLVIDMDAGSEGMALLEAIDACADRPPMIALTGFEESYAAPITRARGAVACLGKPIARAELASTLQEMLGKRETKSDRWGHMMPARIKNRGTNRSLRGIAQKLSPIAQTSS